MDHQQLSDIAKKLVAPGKGILAADESNKSANKRFEGVGVETSEENRRRYRQLLMTTPHAAQYLSGVILYDETFWQNTDSGQPLREYLSEQDIMPGIKVDMGLIDLPGFPGEKVTQGLDGLPERLAKYAQSGAKFAKWRALITIGNDIPTDECIGANTFSLARYARMCQEYNIVPIVEPEVLYDGEHSAERCEQVIAHTYDILFQTMRAFRVDLSGAILKTSMVLPGKNSGNPVNIDEVSERTSRVLKEHVPGELGGVVFLSGGQTPDLAVQNLNAIEKLGPYPWGLTFSYSRALQDPVLKHWAENQTDVAASQQLFAHQLQLAAIARDGQLQDSQLENDNFVSGSQD